MEIQTQFDVHNLVKHKFSSHGKKVICALEIMEVLSNTCYGGTQIYYWCRPIVARVEKDGYGENAKTFWVIGYAIDKGETVEGYAKFREDELVSLTQKEIDIILGA